MIAYNNDFKLMLILTLCAVPLVAAAATRSTAARHRRPGDRGMNAPHRNGLLAALAARPVLAGCASGPDFKRPEPPATQAVSHRRRCRRTWAVPASRAGLRARRRSRRAVVDIVPVSDALDQLVERALAGNRRLAAAATALARRRSWWRRKRRRALPQIDSTAGIGRQKYGAQFLGPLAEAAAVHVFLGRRDRAATRSISPATSARSVEQQRALAEYQQRQQSRRPARGHAAMR